jgi:Fe-S-cluster containining protein
MQSNLLGCTMCAAFTADEESLFHRTGEGVLRRLQKTRNPNERLGVIRAAFGGFDAAYAAADAGARASVACRSGCAACCHEQVAAQAHEVLIAAEFIQRTFSPVDLETAIAQAAAHREAHAGRGEAAWKSPRTPCAMLREGACSIYEARPESCRSHHSHDAALCQINLDAGREEHDVTVPGVRGRMFAVMLGIDHAAESAGYDANAYDFGSALYEALTDSLCAVRWMQRKQAFSDACLEL